MSFGKWVKETREGVTPALSQGECARRAGVSQVQWAKWEAMQGQPRVESVRKAALALGRSVDEAMEAAGYATTPPDVPAEVASYWHMVPPDRQKALLDMWRSSARALASV